MKPDPFGVARTLTSDISGALASQGRIIRNRKVAWLFHYGVAWGFIFYLLVNAVDVLEGYVPGLHQAPCVRINYDLMAQIATAFAREAEAVRSTRTQLAFCQDALRGGDWVGPGAHAFLAEMDGNVSSE